MGEVMKVGSKNFNPSNSISEYIQLAGGSGRLADKSRIILIHPNGSTFWNSDSKKGNAPLELGCVLLAALAKKVIRSLYIFAFFSIQAI